MAHGALVVECLFAVLGKVFDRGRAHVAQFILDSAEAGFVFYTERVNSLG